MAYNAGSSSGNMVLISSQTASSSASINITSGISSAYHHYWFIVSGYLPATNGDNLLIKVSTDGGMTWLAANYTSMAYYTLMNVGGGAINWGTGGGRNDGFALNPAQDNSGIPVSCTGYLIDATSGSNIKMHGQGVMVNGGTNYNFGTGGDSTINNINALQFICPAGNIAQGVFSLYGIQK